jgi:hypothetical protein
MRRAILLLLAASFVLVCAQAFAQKKPATKQRAVMIDELHKGTRYTLIPYEVAFRESHAQLQAMFPDKYIFFFVVVDNRRGSETVVFDPKKGDVTLIMQEGKGRRTMVDLTNTLKDPSVGPKVSQAFKEAYVPIEVPKGEMKHTLAVFSPFNISDIRSALWSFPGENKEMKGKPLTPADIKRFKLEPVGGDSDKKEK